MVANELIINIKHFGWCALKRQGKNNDAHYVYSALGRYFTLCHIEKEILHDAYIMLAPPQFVRCEACLDRIKKETEMVLVKG
ncbi:hypothetical protein LCGC14_1914930 [marine sediment metagenome]|uniref:Uncharacterized protein n=1 Tax=marine sediment metagenome TaxID=412755 RepID=A0A0F9FT66_9ZZZZ